MSGGGLGAPSGHNMCGSCIFSLLALYLGDGLRQYLSGPGVAHQYLILWGAGSPKESRAFGWWELTNRGHWGRNPSSGSSLTGGVGGGTPDKSFDLLLLRGGAGAPFAPVLDQVLVQDYPSCIAGRFLFCSCLPSPRGVRGRVRIATFLRKSKVLGQFRPGSRG